MRSQAEAWNDSLEHATELVDALQDADAPPRIIEGAQALHRDINKNATER